MSPPNPSARHLWRRPWEAEGGFPNIAGPATQSGEPRVYVPWDPTSGEQTDVCLRMKSRRRGTTRWAAATSPNGCMIGSAVNLLWTSLGKVPSRPADSREAESFSAHWWQSPRRCSITASSAWLRISTLLRLKITLFPWHLGDPSAASVHSENVCGTRERALVFVSHAHKNEAETFSVTLENRDVEVRILEV